MKPNLIDDRDKRTIHRRLAKENYDNIITLSTDRSHAVRLLDEGAVVMANGQIDFYIQKGTLQKYLESLPSDYVGTINLGHERFATFPILLGSWTKDDMTLVDIGDGRHGLDVDLHLDYENPLLRAVTQSADKYGYDLGVSAEFSYHVNEEASMEWGVMIIDELFISDFAIVGEAGNVGSSGIQLKGEPMAISLKELSEKLGTEHQDIKSINDAIDKLLANSKDLAVEETVEETVEEVEETVEEPVSEPVEAPTEEVEEEVEEILETEPEDAPEASEEEEITLATVLEAVNGLKTQIEALKTENEALKEQLSAKEQEESAFKDKFKNLVLTLSDEPKATPKTSKVLYTDGIGE